MNLRPVQGLVKEPPAPRVFERLAPRSRQVIVFVLPSLLVLILALWFRQGMRATDDLGYAILAESLLHPGQAVASFSGHHAARAGMTWPLAFVFFLLGVSNWSLALLPLLCTTLTATLVVILAHRFVEPRAAVISGCMYAFFPLTINLATFYVPEPVIIFELTLASILFLSAIENESTGARCLEFMAGLLVGMAYLTTESAALMIPVYGIYLGVRSLVRPRHLWVLVGFGVVFGLELAYYAVTQGNHLYRFTLAADYVNDPMVRSANLHLTDRLLRAYPRYFVYPNVDFGVFGPLLLVGGVYGLLKFRRCSFLVIWAAVILGFYNFMSASMTHYVALPISARLLAPGCVPLLILSGKVVADIWQAVSRSARPVFVLLARASFATVLSAVAVVSLLCMYFGSSTSLTALIARNAEAVAGYLRESPSIVLISDSRSALAVQFYRQFNRQDSFVDFEAPQDALNAHSPFSPENHAFLLLNGPILYEQEITGSRYGAGLSLRSSSTLSQLLPPAEMQIFSARVERGPLFHALLRYGSLQGLLGANKYRIMKNMFEGDPRFGQVRVFRYKAPGERNSTSNGSL